MAAVTLRQRIVSKLHSPNRHEPRPKRPTPPPPPEYDTTLLWICANFLLCDPQCIPRSKIE